MSPLSPKRVRIPAAFFKRCPGPRSARQDAESALSDPAGMAAALQNGIFPHISLIVNALCGLSWLESSLLLPGGGLLLPVGGLLLPGEGLLLPGEGLLLPGGGLLLPGEGLLLPGEGLLLPGGGLLLPGGGLLLPGGSLLLPGGSLLLPGEGLLLPGGGLLLPEGDLLCVGVRSSCETPCLPGMRKHGHRNNGPVPRVKV